MSVTGRNKTFLRAATAAVLSLALSCATKEAAVPRDMPPPPPVKPAKIAVVLGAGASKGFAHIGVLKVLELNRVPVHIVVGTSAGSFVGSLFAAGYKPMQLQGLALNVEKSDLVDLILPDNGFIQGLKLEEYVNRTVRNAPIEKLRIPFYAVATDLQKGREVVFGKGNTGAAVRASCSIPGVFRPVRIGDRLYVDGGVVSPVAVDAARTYGADVVIAVDVSDDSESPPPTGTIDTILQSINVMYAKLSAIQLARADVVIRPKVGHISSADFDKRHEAIYEGEKAAMDAMDAINALLDKLRADGRLNDRGGM